MIGEVDLRTSFPFSRFVKNEVSFSINFAVQGADNDGRVSHIPYPLVLVLTIFSSPKASAITILF